MKKYSRAILLMLALQMAAIPGVGAHLDTTQSATIIEKTVNTQKLAGYFNLYWDAKQGKLWLEIDKWNSEFLYQSGLSAGIGSNDIGLDRGQLGATRIVRFERSGPKVLLVQENLDYRAISDDQGERRAVHDSFAESVLAGFTVGAEEKDRVLVDATDFFLRDAQDSEERAHLYFVTTQIAQFRKDPKLIPIPAPMQPPDGPPIGDDDYARLP